MIVIYKGEDTEFANSGPIQVELDTQLDVTGFTAEISFLGVTKTFGSADVENRILPLSFTENETKQFVLGKDYLLVRVFDTQGRSAILKRVEVDVRLRPSDNNYFLSQEDLDTTCDVLDHFMQIAEKESNFTMKSCIEKVKDYIVEKA